MGKVSPVSWSRQINKHTKKIKSKELSKLIFSHHGQIRGNLEQHLQKMCAIANACEDTFNQQSECRQPTSRHTAISVHSLSFQLLSLFKCLSFSDKNFILFFLKKTQLLASQEHFCRGRQSNACADDKPSHAYGT